MATQARARLLDTAASLFYRDGIHAVGIDQLLRESGVGRASFYRHFDSKQALVTAVLAQRDTHWRACFQAILADCDTPPLGLFDALAERYRADDFRGCGFINAMVEAADRDSPWHHVARRHKQALIEFVAASLTTYDGETATWQATRLVLLLDGAVVTAMREGDTWPLQEARAMAATLLHERPSSA